MTKDKVIRAALKEKLTKSVGNKPNTRIVEELGVTHGVARIDLALINGTLHGYELKSDADTLTRLPAQMQIYNLVFDKITLVVGKKHLYHSLKIVPDWWGISLAKFDSSGKIVIHEIREADNNPEQDSRSIAAFLWKQEALSILESMGEAKGIKSKPREIIYKHLAKVLKKSQLKNIVRHHLCTRQNWRVV